MEDKSAFMISGDTIPEVWEKSILHCWKHGLPWKTEYDKPEDPPSKDCVAMLVVNNPMQEPRIHKSIPAGIEDLEIYVQEVLHGIHDNWVRSMEGGWTYTYHERLFNYEYFECSDDQACNAEINRVNQIQNCIDTLIKCPFSRRAQAITWKVSEDAESKEPPCFCAGTKILTPNGYRNIETLKDGDEVCFYDIETGGIGKDVISNYFKQKRDCVVISLFDRDIKVSSDQLIYTDSGWKKAKDISSSDKIRISSSESGGNISDFMMIGFLHGDAWLSASKHKKNGYYKWCVDFSIHPQTDDSWLKMYLSNNSNSKIVESKKFTKSKVVKNGGVSRKFRIYDKELWTKFSDQCPIGEKIGQQIKIDPFKLSDQEICDFLCGIYSAEGCISVTENNSVSIQIGMNWKECIDFVANLLDIKGIEFNRSETKEGTYKISINKAEEVIKALYLFDFRMDSRKQSQYINVKTSYLYSIQELKNRNKTIKEAQTLKDKNVTIKKIRESIPNCNTRWFSKDVTHKATLRYKDAMSVEYDNFVEVPIVSVSKIGEKTVYDFAISHKDHAILANGIVSHNCLLKMWFRVYEEDKLEMHINIRSNDAFKAAFMNMYAFTAVQQYVAQKVSEGLGKVIKVGRYVHMADSYHIYGSYFNEVENFINRVETTDFSSRVLSTEDVQYFLDSGKITLFNNTQTSIQVPKEHKDRLFNEIPEDRRSELIMPKE